MSMVEMVLDNPLIPPGDPKPIERCVISDGKEIRSEFPFGVVDRVGVTIYEMGNH